MRSVSYTHLDVYKRQDQIAVFHINDSKNPLGAHKDRHANIGEGEIGYDTLHRLVHDLSLIHICY